MEPNETDWRPMWELEEIKFHESEDEELERLLDELSNIQEPGENYAADSN